MRRILGLACLTLVLVLLLNYEAQRQRLGPTTVPGRELSLTCFSRGALLPPSDDLLHNRYPLDDAIIAADRVLRFDSDIPGLRAAFFDGTFNFLFHRNYAAGQVNEFTRDIAALPSNAICAFTSQGAIAWAPLASLGAEAVIPPHAQLSWCMVSVKRPAGWVKLAEVFSLTRGVSLAFSVSPELFRYDGYCGDFLVIDTVPSAEIHLCREFGFADEGRETARSLSQTMMGGVPLPVIATPLSQSVAWNRIRLGAAPFFRCGLGYIGSRPGEHTGMVFSLLLNNEVVASKQRDVETERAPAWELLEANLSAFAGQTVRLEIRAEPEGEEPGGWAVWGDPVIGWASEETAYAFFVAGHVYGHPHADDASIHPPFLDKLDWIRSRSCIRMGFFTGDIVRRARAEDWDGVDRAVQSLGMPIHFAVGNHDMKDRALFESRYGKTYYSFTLENDLFVVLDPNLDGWNISGDQLEFLKNTLEENAECDNVFLFMHQIIWADLKKIFRKFTPNSLDGRAEKVNYGAEVEPLLRGLDKPVYLFAGDTGAFPSGLEIMYYRYGEIRLIASGMGGGERDNFLVMKVKTDKTVEPELIALNGDDPRALGDLEDHLVVDP